LSLSSENPAVSKFAFKWVNLYRHVEAVATMADICREAEAYVDNYAAGLYQSNPVDPQLETAWSRPLSP
jgi:hypothetical protein